MDPDYCRKQPECAYNKVWQGADRLLNGYFASITLRDCSSREPPYPRRRRRWERAEAPSPADARCVQRCVGGADERLRVRGAPVLHAGPMPLTDGPRPAWPCCAPTRESVRSALAARAGCGATAIFRGATSTTPTPCSCPRSCCSRPRWRAWDGSGSASWRCSRRSTRPRVGRHVRRADPVAGARLQPPRPRAEEDGRPLRRRTGRAAALHGRGAGAAARHRPCHGGRRGGVRLRPRPRSTWRRTCARCSCTSCSRAARA